MINSIIEDLKVQGDDEEEKLCSIASVIAVASTGIGNSTWVENFYRCLPAMDTKGKISISPSPLLFFPFIDINHF